MLWCNNRKINKLSRNKLITLPSQLNIHTYIVKLFSSTWPYKTWGTKWQNNQTK